MLEPVAFTFAAGIDKPNCIKGNADGSGTILFSFSSSDGARVWEMYNRLRKQPILISVVLADDAVIGRKAED